jgi:hypothetical protein
MFNLYYYYSRAMGKSFNPLKALFLGGLKLEQWHLSHTDEWNRHKNGYKGHRFGPVSLLYHTDLAPRAPEQAWHLRLPYLISVGQQTNILN